MQLLAGVCLLLQLSAAAHLCPNSHQYWSTESGYCVNCSKCTTAEKPIVLRPCQGHVDTECGVLSDLNIDWSWLTKKDNKKHTTFEKNHHKHSHLPVLDEIDDFDKDLEKKKHHNKKIHKHHDLLDDQDFFTDEVVDKKVHHHGHSNEHKHHAHIVPKVFNEEDEPEFEGNKHNKKHHISFESFLRDGDSQTKHHHGKKVEDDNISDYIEAFRKHSGKTEDLEKEWNKMLALSKTRLQHRKADLIKTLREEGNPESEKHLKEINHESEFNMFDELDNRKKVSSEELSEDGYPSFHHKDSTPKKPFSKMDVNIFEELVNEEHKRQRDNPTIDLLKLMKSGDGPNRISHDMELYRKHHKDEVPFPVDSFDYKSIVPTHRLFLGEPSTISEIMDQDLFNVKSEEGKFNKESSKFKVIPWDESNSLDEREPKMSAVKFTAAERFVWDWQAVALTSAVAACLLFFAVVAVYSVLHARQWRRLKSNINTGECLKSVISSLSMLVTFRHTK